jgi:hypothetical protein
VTLRLARILPALALLAAACSAGAAPATTPPPGPAATAASPDGPIGAFGDAIPPAPDVPTGPLDEALAADLDAVFQSLLTGVDENVIFRIGQSGDPRVAWLLSDLLRFFQSGEIAFASEAAFEDLTGAEVTDDFAWGQVTDWLIAWDIPAPPGYVEWKRIPFEIVEPAWEPFFSDDDVGIDWRHLSWGGVPIDDRPLRLVALPCPEGCIPALDDPAVTDAAGGDWYPDDALVFGVVVEGEARAYPKNVMEVHEMVNDTLGGRRIGMPYCTLCGSAQAYFTDRPPDGFPEETLELRTSGLLVRSNKLMYEFHTFSAFDTFLGVGLSGPLQGHHLGPVTVVTATWGDWKSAHPATTIVARDGGIGRSYPADPLGGRDDGGPIFPVGDVDPRLPAQAQVLGVIAPDGTAVAFEVEAARRSLDAGVTVEAEGVVVRFDGAGLVAETGAGEPLVSHQAFWFAWSQFHPGTALWAP